MQMHPAFLNKPYALMGEHVEEIFCSVGKSQKLKSSFIAPYTDYQLAEGTLHAMGGR